jgi:hypothetical protein
MLPYQQRVIDEKAVLDERLVKLNKFLATDTFAELPQDEQDRMQRQAKYMKRYSEILGQRIEAFLGTTLPD